MQREIEGRQKICVEFAKGEETWIATDEQKAHYPDILSELTSRLHLQDNPGTKLNPFLCTFCGT